ncbi:MAG: DUF2614 family zinc ribbon-containing protein [Firmicutes bacterium]|nr:DUF2614 family zinc ribbon-containing protein [Bacillota bacterium]
MKLNRLRNLAMILMFSAFIVMYLSSFSTLSPAKAILLPIGLSVGTLILLLSVAIYFRLGVISMRLPQVRCPHCERITKMMGASDGCMFCKKALRLDVDEEGDYIALKA